MGQVIQNVGVCLENKIDDEIDQTGDVQVARTGTVITISTTNCQHQDIF